MKRNPEEMVLIGTGIEEAEDEEKPLKRWSCLELEEKPRMKRNHEEMVLTEPGREAKDEEKP